jgi:Tol biopolymer transport system component
LINLPNSVGFDDFPLRMICVAVIDLQRETNPASRSILPTTATRSFQPIVNKLTFDLYLKAVTGVGAEELIQKGSPYATDWSPDGKTLLYSVVGSATNFDVWALPMTGERKPYPVLTDKFTQQRAKFFPDGHWILYTTQETGRTEIYVQTFPSSGGKWQISVAGGQYAYWRGDGKEIIFDSPDGEIMAVDVKLGKTLEAGVPHELFQLPTVNGSRFIVSRERPALSVCRASAER